MTDIDTLLKQRSDLAAQLTEIDTQIRTHTGLPHEWEILSGGPMAGGVALRGPACNDPNRDAGTATISVSCGSQYGEVFFIIDDERGERSPWVDPEAVRAALRVYDERRAQRSQKRGPG